MVILLCCRLELLTEHHARHCAICDAAIFETPIPWGSTVSTPAICHRSGRTPGMPQTTGCATYLLSQQKLGLERTQLSTEQGRELPPHYCHRRVVPNHL